MTGRPRDTQRSRVYAAEGWKGWSRAAERLLVEDRSRSLGAGSVERYSSVEACQAYVDDLLAQRWVRARWGERHIEVRDGRMRVNACAEGSSLVRLPVWARTEATILHEVAHCLRPYGTAGHGPEYAAIMVTLVRYRVGAEAAAELRAAYRSGRVRVAALPKPTRAVPTKASLAAAARPRMVGTVEAARAAETIRSMVRLGRFGPAGSKPRRHALDVARACEAQ